MYYTTLTSIIPSLTCLIPSKSFSNHTASASKNPNHFGSRVNNVNHVGKVDLTTSPNLRSTQVPRDRRVGRNNKRYQQATLERERTITPPTLMYGPGESSCRVLGASLLVVSFDNYSHECDVMRPSSYVYVSFCREFSSPVSVAVYHQDNYGMLIVL